MGRLAEKHMVLGPPAACCAGCVLEAHICPCLLPACLPQEEHRRARPACPSFSVCCLSRFSSGKPRHVPACPRWTCLKRLVLLHPASVPPRSGWPALRCAPCSASRCALRGSRLPFARSGTMHTMIQITEFISLPTPLATAVPSLLLARPVGPTALRFFFFFFFRSPPRPRPPLFFLGDLHSIPHLRATPPSPLQDRPSPGLRAVCCSTASCKHTCRRWSLASHVCGCCQRGTANGGTDATAARSRCFSFLVLFGVLFFFAFGWPQRQPSPVGRRILPLSSAREAAARVRVCVESFFPTPPPAPPNPMAPSNLHT